LTPFQAGLGLLPATKTVKKACFQAEFGILPNEYGREQLLI
jgi:hypothetical protein